MTCQEFWNASPELAADTGADTRAHAQECPRCAAMLGSHETLAGGLRAVAAEWSRVKAPGRVEGKLLAAFRGQAGLATPAPARGWWQTAATWAAAAAVVAIAVLLFVVRERQVRAPKAQPAVELAGADWSAAMPSLDDFEEDDFIPLPNAERLAPEEDVNLVRVEVPRSAMIALGFAVSPERAAEMVQADLVLGSDGLARAVRFLDE